jgi:hypothetical protein
MKKILTLLFSVGLVTAAFSQRDNTYRNDDRNYDNSYQTSPYSNNDQYNYPDQYRNDDRYYSEQWNGRGDRYRFERERRRRALERYEYEMMMRRRAQAMYYNQRRYSPYVVSPRPSIQVRIGIGGRRY